MSTQGHDINFVELEYPGFFRAKVQYHRTSGSGEEFVGRPSRS